MTTAEGNAPCRRESSNVRKEGMRSLGRNVGTESPNKEWDQCVRKGTLTLGAGMAAGMFVSILFGVGVPLAWGTGAGILWSLKTCRALMRDGIMTPEQKRAKKEERIIQRGERRRMLKEEKNKKKTTQQKPPKSPKPPKKQSDDKDDNHTCCKKLKDLLEKQKQKECDLMKKIEKELEKCGIQIEGDMLCPRDGSDMKIETPKDESQGLDTSKLNFKSTTTVKLFYPPSKAFRTTITANGTDICMCREGSDGSIETCASCALPVSSTKEIDQPTQLTLLDDPFKKSNDEDDDDLIFPKPQQNRDEGNGGEDIVSGSQPEDGIRMNPSDLLILKEVKSTNEEDDDLYEDEEYEDEQKSPTFFDELLRPIHEDTEEGVTNISDDPTGQIIHDVDDDGTGNQDYSPEIVLTDMSGNFTHEVSHRDEQFDEEYSKEEVIFVETYKSESWPFSFSLPSLDKFHKKSSDSTFKWPPLPSSIIVRPRKEPTCTCAGGNGQEGDHKHANEKIQPEPSSLEKCKCGQAKNDCKCV